MLQPLQHPEPQLTAQPGSTQRLPLSPAALTNATSLACLVTAGPVESSLLPSLRPARSHRPAVKLVQRLLPRVRLSGMVLAVLPDTRLRLTVSGSPGA